MPLALDRKSIEYMAAIFQEVKKFRPQIPGRFGGFEGSGITYKDETIACTRNKNVETFRGVHEPDCAMRVRSSQTRDHYITFFTLIVVWKTCREWVDQERAIMYEPMVASRMRVL